MAAATTAKKMYKMVAMHITFKPSVMSLQYLGYLPLISLMMPPNGTLVLLMEKKNC